MSGPKLDVLIHDCEVHPPKFDVVHLEGFDSDSDATLVYVDGEYKCCTDRGCEEELVKILRPDANVHYRKWEIGQDYPKTLEEILGWPLR